MRSVQSFLGDAVLQKEALRAARANRILDRWADIVGEKLAERSWPDRYDHGMVWVAVTGSAWAQELRMMKDTILSRLNEQSHERGLFTDIRFGVRVLRRPDDDEPISEKRESEITGLTIREIAERRLRALRDVEGN